MKRKPSRHHRDRSRPAFDDALIGRDPSVSDELFEAFLKNVEAFESAPTTTLSRLLISDGIKLPSPDTFTETTVRDTLWEVIHGMARRRHFLESTDHLSDLELYRKLWEETLNEPAEDLRGLPSGTFWNIDLVSSGSEEAIELWLRHYADEVARDLWASDFPNDRIPDHVDPPYDRDRHLPKMQRPGAG